MTTLDHWIQFRGQQGGTLCGALREFAELPMRDKDRFCGILCDNIATISDPHHASEFMHARISYLRIGVL